MNESDIRPKLRSGDLLLCAGTSWFSRLIQAATGSEWSHVGLILRLDSVDRVMLLESVESVGVRAVPLSHYFEDYQQSGASYPGKLAFYRHRDFPTDQGAGPTLKRLGRFAVDRLGWPYDGQQIAELAARLALHRLGAGSMGQGAPWADSASSPQAGSLLGGSLENRAYICSEYVAACYAALDIEIACRNCPYVTPGDFVVDTRMEALG